MTQNLKTWTLYILLIVLFSTSGLAWLSGYNYRREITTNSQVSGTLTNFPQYIQLDTATLIGAAKMQSDCDDIRITYSNDTIVSFEIEDCNAATTTIWFSVPSFPSGDQSFYVYYDNSSVTNGENAANVWTAYELVYHFDLDDGQTGAVDSTGNGHTGTISGSPLFVTNASCGFSSCIFQENNTNAENVAFTPGWNPSTQGDYTIEFWTEPHYVSGSNLITGATATDYYIYMTNTFNWIANIDSATSVQTGNNGVNDAQLVPMAVRESSGNTAWFINGTNIIEQTKVSNKNFGDWYLGRGSTADFYSGSYDEYRQSLDAKSSDWLGAVANMTYALGTESSDTSITVNWNSTAAYTESTSFDYVYNVTGTGLLSANCSIYWNSTLEETQNNRNANTSYTFTVSKSPTLNANITSYIECFGDNGLNANSTTRYVYFNLTVITTNLTSFTTTQHYNFSVNITHNDIYGAVTCGLYDNSSNFTCSSGVTSNNMTTSICSDDSTFLDIDLLVTPFCQNSSNSYNGTAKTIDYRNYGQINFTATYPNGTNVTNFRVDYGSSNTTGSGSVTRVNRFWGVLSNYSYFQADTIATSNASLITNVTSQSYNFNVYFVNAINFSFYLEDTTTLVSWVNISLELISTTFAANYTVENGTIFLSLLTPAAYTIRYSADNFTERLYYFELSNRTVNSLDLYMINSSLSPTEVTATVVDQFGNELEGALIKVLKYNINTNTYDTVEIVATNFNGEAILNLFLNSEFYQFIIEYPTGTVVQTTNPTYVYTNTVTFQVSLLDNLIQNYEAVNSVTASLIFNDATNNFRYTYTDTQNTAVQGCLYVYTSNTLGDNLINQSCSASSSGTILIPVENISGSTYMAVAYIDLETGVSTYIDTLYKTFPYDNNVGKIGLLLVLILVLVFAGTAYWSPVVAVLVTPLPITFGTYMGLINVGWTQLLGLHIVSIIIAFVVGRSR